MSAMPTDDGGFDGADDDVLAGEYVLGTLDAADRLLVRSRMMREEAFAARVVFWQSRLGALDELYAPVAPPAGLLSRVEGRLFGAPPQGQPQPAGGLWQSLALWRGLAFASLILVAGLAATNFSGLSTPAPPGETTAPLVAHIASEEGPVSLVAAYDESHGIVRLTPVASTAPQPRSLELWLIEGDRPPVSLGLIPDDGRGDLSVAPDLRDRFTEGAVLAISLEPAGGSPSGSPTGPVVGAGPALRQTP
jgi:anti-sigma-K factor RskA